MSYKGTTWKEHIYVSKDGKSYKYPKWYRESLQKRKEKDQAYERMLGLDRGLSTANSMRSYGHPISGMSYYKGYDQMNAVNESVNKYNSALTEYNKTILGKVDAAKMHYNDSIVGKINSSIIKAASKTLGTAKGKTTKAVGSALGSVFNFVIKGKR